MLHSNCSMCDRLNLRKKNRFVCAPWLSVNMKSVVELEIPKTAVITHKLGCDK